MPKYNIERGLRNEGKYFDEFIYKHLRYNLRCSQNLFEYKQMNIFIKKDAPLKK